jgi:uncharacterized beta-barrel protein YwiB (DUF1934 family)
MIKEILVSISGLQYETNPEDPIEMIAVGEYYYRNGKHYVLYEEMEEEEGAANGLTKNTIKIRGKQVEILKSGANNVHMVFEEGQKNMTYYNTPVGNLLIGIYTTKIKIVEDKDIMEIHIEYDLEVNYTHVSDCIIKIGITPRKI